MKFLDEDSGCLQILRLALKKKYGNIYHIASNEIRQIVGIKPSNDPKADQLINSNLNHPEKESVPTQNAIGQYPPEGYVDGNQDTGPEN